MKNKGTFSLNKGKPFYSWYQYMEGYSEEFVLNEIKNIPNVNSVYDPFGGSGTTMLFASLHGIKSYYSEINPFMALVAETKINSSRYCFNHLSDFEQNCQNVIQEVSTNLKPYEKKVKETDFTHFYDADVFKRSFAIKLIINKFVSDIHFKNVMMLALSSNILEVSNMIKQGDVRKANAKELQKKNKNIVELFVKKLESLINDIKTEGSNLTFDTVKLSEDSRDINEKDLVDAVITSPPYLNGTNYFRNTKLELNLCDFLINEIDIVNYHSRGIIAGINNVSSKSFKANHYFDCVEDVLKELRPVAYDRRIPMMIEGYFDNMYDVLIKIKNILKVGGVFVLDIGDSQFCGVHVPTHEILEKLTLSLGFEKIDEEILRKRYSNNGMLLSQRIIRFRRID